MIIIMDVCMGFTINVHIFLLLLWSSTLYSTTSRIYECIRTYTCMHAICTVDWCRYAPIGTVRYQRITHEVAVAQVSGAPSNPMCTIRSLPMYTSVRVDQGMWPLQRMRSISMILARTYVMSLPIS